MFGLAETVGSLVNPLSNALNNASPQDVFNLLGVTLQQMGTAFSYALVGIFFALSVGGMLRFTTGTLQSLLSDGTLILLKTSFLLSCPKARQPRSEFTGTHYKKPGNRCGKPKVSRKDRSCHARSSGTVQGVLTTAGEAMQQSVEKLTQTAQAMQEKLQYVAQGVTQSVCIGE